jgi:DNA polymerase III sliding clamp (beta) subunit (PCNA family)
MMAECMQGNFPNYHMLIPEIYQCKATFSTPLLIQRLNMVDFKETNGGIVRYFFNQPKSLKKEVECLIQIYIKSDKEQPDMYSLTMPLTQLEKTGKIALQMKYIQDAIKPFSVCEWEINSLEKPIKITSDIKGLTMVVMPMHVEWK